jgi:hypothetical protein
MNISFDYEINEMRTAANGKFAKYSCDWISNQRRGQQPIIFSILILPINCLKHSQNSKELNRSEKLNTTKKEEWLTKYWKNNQ